MFNIFCTSLIFPFDNYLIFMRQQLIFASRHTFLSQSIFSIVQVVGSAVAIIMLVVLAIKYMSAAPGDKAEIKKHAVVYVTGAIVLFGSAGILSIIEQFASTNITGD